MENGRMTMGGPLSWLDLVALSFRGFIRDGAAERALAVLSTDLSLVPSSFIGQELQLLCK